MRNTVRLRVGGTGHTLRCKPSAAEYLHRSRMKRWHFQQHSLRCAHCELGSRSDASRQNMRTWTATEQTRGPGKRPRPTRTVISSALCRAPVPLRTCRVGAASAERAASAARGEEATAAVCAGANAATGGGPLAGAGGAVSAAAPCGGCAGAPNTKGASACSSGSGGAGAALKSATKGGGAGAGGPLAAGRCGLRAARTKVRVVVEGRAAEGVPAAGDDASERH